MEKNILKLAAEQLEKYLNLAQEFTEDYYITMDMGEDSEAIIKEKSEKLKRIEAMIYVCKDQLRFTDHEINYSSSGFNVEILKN